MNSNSIHIKLKDKKNINLKKNNILELFKLSAGNNIINKEKKNSSNQNLEIIYYKKYIKKDVGKMIYIDFEIYKVIKLMDKLFIRNNIKRAKIIINNKQYELKENIVNQSHFFKIKIKFLDNIIELNSMFEDCKLLYSINNFQNLNTKYLKTINDLFSGCNSLYYIDDISDWNLNNVNNIS